MPMWIWLIPLALVVLWFVYRQLTQVSVAEVKALVAQGARLIDVRNPSEYASGNIPGSINIPINELSQRASELGAKDEPKVVYCASGTRSALARSLLRSQGFQKVFNLGAMGRWGAV